MTMPTPPRYHRSDTLTIEALQNDGHNTEDLLAWIPANKVRLTDMGGTAAIYVQTIDGTFERLWLGQWVIRYADGNFDQMNNARFTAEFAPVQEKEPTPGSVDPIDADLEADAAQLDALVNGVTTALNTADYWSAMAEALTGYRSRAAAMLPKLPCSEEEWFETRKPQLPFDRAELAAQLEALSGLITKAYTIAVVYASESARLDEAYAAVAPD